MKVFFKFCGATMSGISGYSGAGLDYVGCNHIKAWLRKHKTCYLVLILDNVFFLNIFSYVVQTRSISSLNTESLSVMHFS